MVEEIKVQVFNPLRPMFVTIKETAFGIGIMLDGQGFSMKPQQAVELASKLLEFTRKYVDSQK